LYFPIHWLIELVKFFSQLPGNSIALGTISVLQLLAIYGLFILAWHLPWWQQRWWLVGVIGFTLILVPVWQTQATLFRVTLLATEAEPVLVIQEHGKVTLINTGNADNVRFTLLPFLQQQGINQMAQ
jgi:competence protein ComEC